MPKPKTIQPGPGAHHTTSVVGMPLGKPVIIDATGLVVGRLASNVAKRLLQGETITIINAEKAVITGERQALFEEYKTKREMGTDRKGPFYPRMPHLLVKRVVRGMLPNQRGNGRAAFQRLIVHIGRPDDVQGEATTVEQAKTRAARFVTVGDLTKRLGAKF